MRSLNLNMDSVVSFTNELEKLHRSGLPLAVRGTLNKTAFHVKSTTLPKSSDKAFTNRSKNFFKATSRVEIANGWDIKKMRSTIGFSDQRLRGSNNDSVDNLEKQEYGGKIPRRNFIPTDNARRGSKTKLVSGPLRLNRVKDYVNASKMKGKTHQQKFVRAAQKAGKGGYVLGNLQIRKIYKIKSIKTIGGKTIIKTQHIYSFKPDRSVSIKPTGFMREATISAGKKMNMFFIDEAKRQINRLTA